MQPLLTQLLGLPGIEVEDYHDFGDKIILEVEARTEIAAYTLWEREQSSASESLVFCQRFRHQPTTSAAEGESTTV
jgi:uncharacterized protein YuzE